MLFSFYDPINDADEIEMAANTAWNERTDFVPDEATAIKIAEAIWLPILGESIYNRKPFIATLNDSIWTVRGTLPDRIDLKGGIPYIKIRKSDSKIIRVYYTR